MKQIKKIVLKDATRLTNSEMKSIRGGYEPERSAICSVQCAIGAAELDCSIYGDGVYCDLYSGVGVYRVGCYSDYDGLIISEHCIDPEVK